jgi:glutamate-1-semialdehyde 2,1-aminomutase
MTGFAVDEAVIDRLIDREQSLFADNHPRSAALWAEGRRHFLYGGPSHWMRRWAGGFPIYVDSAHGATIVDVDGHRYTDFCLGDTGGMCGHGCEPVTRAATAQLERGATTMLPTGDSVWVGQELARRFGLPYWSFTTSATDANRAAIRIARILTGRDKVLVFSGCYHGGVEEAHVQLVDGRMQMRNMIHPNGLDHRRISKVVEFNDRDALEAALADGDVACVLAEPVMTNFGMIPPEPGFHEALRALTRQAGTLLVIDETHTLSSGFGGYSRQHGLEPDLFVIGKAIAGGIPAGVFGATAEVARRMWEEVPWLDPRARQSSHLGMGGTLAGSALTVAATRAVLAEVLTEAAYERMAGLAATLAEGARAVIARHGLAWHVTQVGGRCEIMFGPEPPRNGAESAAMRRGLLETLLHAHYLNRGIIVTPFHTMFLMCPATAPADVEAHAAIFDNFLRMVLEAGAVAADGAR